MIKNRCVNCDYVIEAEDGMRGQETVCPNCEATNLLQGPEDLELEEVEHRLEESRERARFMDSLSRSRGEDGPASGGWQVPIESLPAHDLALMASRRLKDVSLYLLFFAYLLAILAVVLGAVIAVGAELPVIWRVVAFLTGAFLALVAFVYFKFMSESVRVLAEVTDLARSIDSRLAVLESETRRSRQGVGPHPVEVGAPELNPQTSTT